MTQPSATPTISVITATRGRPQNLAQLVPTVLADETVRHFVVVVDGKDEKSVNVLSSLQPHFDRLIFRSITHSGQMRALEIGVTLTDAEVVLLIDDDVVPTPGLASAHARGHANEDGLVLVGTMPVELVARRPNIASLLYAREYLAHCSRIEAGEQEVLDHLWLGNVSIRRSDCLSVGLHSDDFTASYHADRDLGFRMAEAGLVGRYDPSLVASHRHRRSDRAFLHDARRRGAGLARLHAVHERLGPFDPNFFTQGLPPSVATLVRLVGPSRAAPYIARGLLGLGAALGMVGWRHGRILLAKLSRRIMLVWGTTAGEGPLGRSNPRVVLIVADYIPALGGTTTQTRLQAIELARRGWDVTVLTRRVSLRGSRELIDGIPVRRVSLAGRGRLAKATYLASCWLWLRLRRRQLSAVNVIMDADFAVAACIAGLSAETVLTWVTRGDATRQLVGAVGRARLRLLRGCSQVALTPLIQSELEQLTVTGAHVIPIPVDTSRFRQPDGPERRDAKSALEIGVESVVLFVGHLQERKAVDRLLGAVKVLVDKGFDLILLAVGGPVEVQDNQYVEDLKAYVQANSLSRHVRFCGAQGDVLPFLFAADIFCLPSHREGMPNVLLEAMACGLPCVAPASAGGDELLANGAGIVPLSNSADDLAVAIGNLLTDPEAQQGVRRLAIERVVRLYRIVDIVDEYEKIFLDRDAVLPQTMQRAVDSPSHDRISGMRKNSR